MINTNQEILISVIILTYNHEEYISVTLDSIIEQNSPYPIQIIICDDCSTDGTNSIIEKYTSNETFKITYFRQLKNVGIMNNMKKAFELVEGRFIAFCEGDDYWIDSNKLKRQVEFLKNNPFYIAHTENTIVDFGETKCYFSEKNTRDISTKELLMGRQFSTSSIIFDYSKILIPDWYFQLIFGDTSLFVILSRFGKIRYNSVNISSVYRKHSQGITQSIIKNEEILKGILEINLKLNEYTNHQFSEVIKKNISQSSYVFLINNFNKLKKDNLKLIEKSLIINSRRLFFFYKVRTMIIRLEKIKRIYK